MQVELDGVSAYADATRADHATPLLQLAAEIGVPRFRRRSDRLHRPLTEAPNHLRMVERGEGIGTLLKQRPRWIEGRVPQRGVGAVLLSGLCRGVKQLQLAG